MKKFIFILLLLLLPVFSFSQIVSIYCTWDDLEAARQQRVFGNGLNEMLRQAGYYVVEKDHPNRELADSLITSDIKLVIGSSHGSPTTFFDCNDWSAIWTTDAPEHFGPVQGKIVHLLACQAGNVLGPAMVSKGGAKTVIAYTEDFNFSGQSKYNDYCARGDAEFDRALVQDGCSAGDAYLKAKNKFIELANLANEAGEAAEYETLMHNANCIAIFGDHSAKLTTFDMAMSAQATRKEKVKILLRKLKKPTDKILKKIIVTLDGEDISFLKYRTLKRLKKLTKIAEAVKNSTGKKKKRKLKRFKKLSQRILRRICIKRYKQLKDTYRLGIRGKVTRLLTKREIIQEIRNNTKTGKFLMRRYQKFLDTLEELLEE